MRLTRATTSSNQDQELSVICSSEESPFESIQMPGADDLAPDELL
jgi:hypothetical protein